MVVRWPRQLHHLLDEIRGKPTAPHGRFSDHQRHFVITQGGLAISAPTIFAVSFMEMSHGP